MDNAQTSKISGYIRFTWRKLLQLAVLANLLGLLYKGLFETNTLALILFGLMLAGLGLLRFRNGIIGILLIGLLNADTAFWTLTGAASNFANGEHLSALLLPSYLGLISLLVLTAAVGSWMDRKEPGRVRRPAAISAVATVLLLVLIIAIGVPVSSGSRLPVDANSLAINAENMHFSTTELVSDNGQVTINFTNQDLWWHTFTIDELDVNLNVPMGAVRTAEFKAPPGTYTFYCGIPGHAAAGMNGTLTVR